MSRVHKKKRKNKGDLLNQNVSSGFTREDKLVLNELRKEYNTSYAALVRKAVHEYYRDEFARRAHIFDR